MSDSPLFLVYTQGVLTEDQPIFAFTSSWAAGQKIKQMNNSTPFIWELAIF